MIDCEVSDDHIEDAPLTRPKKTLTNKEILSQALLLLIGGYDTTATTLCFIAYLLATNQGWQDKLCQEIDNAYSASVNVLFINILK